MRGVYAARRQALMDALARHAPGLELRGLAAGFHVLVLLPEGVTEDEVVSAAARALGGRVRPWRQHVRRAALAAGARDGLREPGEGAIEKGIEAVADLLRG